MKQILLRASVATFMLLGCRIANAADMTTVNVGIANASSDVAFFIADKKGYFRDEGIDAKFIPVRFRREDGGAARRRPARRGGRIAIGRSLQCRGKRHQHQDRRGQGLDASRLRLSAASGPQGSCRLREVQEPCRSEGHEGCRQRQWKCVHLDDERGPQEGRPEDRRCRASLSRLPAACAGAGEQGRRRGVDDGAVRDRGRAPRRCRSLHGRRRDLSEPSAGRRAVFEHLRPGAS